MARHARLLRFRCTGCGNCCRDPLLPLTDADVWRIAETTGDDPTRIVRWVSSDDIDLADLPEVFVDLRQGSRVMVLRQTAGSCRYLGTEEDADACRMYEHRPLGCRIFPFEPTFTKRGTLKHLKLIDTTECPYELDGSNDVDELRRLSEQFDSEWATYCERIEVWNRLQRARRRRGVDRQTGRTFFKFLEIFATEGEASTSSAAQ